MENCFLLAFNYIQTFSESNGYVHKRHILYEASASVVNMANGYCYVDKSVFHFPFKCINRYLDINTKTNKDEITDEELNQNQEELNNLSECLETLVSEYDIKYVWVYGNNQILFQLPVLQNLAVFDIRNKNSHTFRDKITINKSFNEYRNVLYRRGNIYTFPPVLHSITNLCHLLAQNLINGYQDSTKSITFYTTNKNSNNDLQCNFHLEGESSSTCACLLNEINRLTLMFISASQELYTTEYKDYINSNHRDKERMCQYMAEREVEYKLQALLLSMVWPEKIHWQCRRNINGMDVGVTILNSLVKNKYNWIQWEVRNFNKHVMKQTRVNHQDSYIIANILIFLGYEETHNICKLP